MRKPNKKVHFILSYFCILLNINQILEQLCKIPIYNKSLNKK